MKGSRERERSEGLKRKKRSKELMRMRVKQGLKKRRGK